MKVDENCDILDLPMAQSMFFGRYEYLLDDKNRVRLPNQFRDYFGDLLYMGKGDGNYLILYRADEINEIIEKADLVLAETTSREKQMYYRDVFSDIFDSKRDTQGRYVIPAPLVAYAELKDNVYVIGNRHHVEIWSKENFENRYEDNVAFSRTNLIERKQKDAAIKKEIEETVRGELLREYEEARLRKEITAELKKQYEGK